MSGKENIFLDATLENVINHAVFEARLDNGHQVVAYVDRADRGRQTELRPGGRVCLRMSPYDMSKGCIEFRENVKDR